MITHTILSTYFQVLSRACNHDVVHLGFLKAAYTAWDSEIESLTSLIKLHQSERRSAPCGQIGAATQPPELATSWSPTLKKFWVARAFEVRWTCTCCRGRAVSNCYSFYHLLISVFFFVSLAVLKNTNIAEQVRSVDNTCLILWPATSGIDNAFDPATHWLQKWIVALHNPIKPLSQLSHTLNTSTKQCLDDTTTLYSSSSLSPRPTAAIPSSSIFEERTTTEGKWKKRKTRTRMLAVLSWLIAANSSRFLSCTWF